MEFKKYNSIENSFQKDFIRKIKAEGLSNVEYVVQEKIHGANFSFITDGKEIKIAKRTEIILETEYFFNAKEVQAKYHTQLLNLYQDVAEKYEAKIVTVFGELFGGGYPHPDVAKDEQAKLVQRGIYYSPSNDFYAYDIMIEQETYLDVDTVNSLFEKHGFIYAKTLFKGTLKECLDFPINFKTTLPSALNLPELEGNICEGVVIKPIQPVYLRIGTKVIIKNKNEDWAENNKQIDPTILSKLLHEGEELTAEASFLSAEIYKLITENRLQNVVSKIGEINPRRDYGKLLGLLNKDVFDDFFKEYKAAYEALEKHENKAINKFVNKHSGTLIVNFLDTYE